MMFMGRYADQWILRTCYLHRTWCISTNSASNGLHVAWRKSRIFGKLYWISADSCNWCSRRTDRGNVKCHHSAVVLAKTFLQTPDITEQLRLHFICFVEVDDHLYELDGRRSFPINHGKCSNFIEVYTNCRWIKHFTMSNIQCSI